MRSDAKLIIGRGHVHVFAGLVGSHNFPVNVLCNKAVGGMYLLVQAFVSSVDASHLLLRQMQDPETESIRLDDPSSLPDS